LLHLQCHFGQDTLSWARKGAVVTGIDFSENAIAAARDLAQRANLPAAFVLSNVYDLPSTLTGEFDFVFSTYGAIPWLPDLEKWAAIVSRFLKKGGVFYLAEFHPTLYMFNFDTYKVGYHYFNKRVYEETVSGTYADPSANLVETEYFWNHPHEEVLMSLLGQGLRLTEFREYDFSPYACFPNMVEREPGRFAWGNFGVRLPHIYSVKMVKD
jgi:ubiquinone/menaquinone biosynthesis C-methylase UbiE